MNKPPYVIKKVLEDYVVEDLKSELKNHKSKISGVINSEKGKTIDLEFRNSLSIPLPRWIFPDICVPLERVGEKFDYPNKLSVKELEHLSYGLDGKFSKHRDVSEDAPLSKSRRLTAITLLSKSEDLEGGMLKVYNTDDTAVYKPNLNVGETIFFYSTTWHEVTPITRGHREVLVCWLYLKQDKE